MEGDAYDRLLCWQRWLRNSKLICSTKAESSSVAESNAKRKRVDQKTFPSQYARFITCCSSAFYPEVPLKAPE